MPKTPRFDANAAFANRAYVADNLGRKVQDAKVGFLGDVRALWAYLNDKPLAVHVAIILFALGYFIWPLDVVPDVIPVAGYADDAAVIAWAVSALGSAIARYRQ